MAQKDMKKLVAYSSVSHLGFVMLGMFALNPTGLERLDPADDQPRHLDRRAVPPGRRHLRAPPHREIAEYGGLSKQMPVYATLLPDHRHVVDRAAGAQRVHRRVHDPARRVRSAARVWAAFGALGIVLGAAYMLWLYQRVFFGPLDNPENAKLHGPQPPRDRLCSCRWSSSCFWIGLYPKPFFDVLERPVNYVVARVDKDYAEQLRAAGTLPTLRPSSPTAGGGPSVRRREVGHGPARHATSSISGPRSCSPRSRSRCC